MHYNLAEQRQHRTRLVPDPPREVLAGRILQAYDLIEIVMIEALVDRLERRFHVGEIHHPAAVRIHRSAQMQLDAKGMAVQPRALVPGRHVGQAVRGFDREGAEDIQRTAADA